MLFKDLDHLLMGKFIQLSQPNLEVQYLLTDSRKSVLGPESLFFAIMGENHDGHYFIEELYDRGCRQFIIEKPLSTALPEANILRVENAIKALQDIASRHRSQFSLPVIGITGSNGKTIVKEWLGQLLSRKIEVTKNPKSYNSQIGVPLSVWQINQHHKIGIFEAGISQPGEMKKLQSVIRPEEGIFTNLGPAHDEGFTDRIQKAREKARLFEECKQIIYRCDYPEIDEVLQAIHGDDVLTNWTTGTDSSAQWKVDFDQKKTPLAQIKLRRTSTKQKYFFNFQFADLASLENITHCIIYLLEKEWEPAEIQAGIHTLRQVNMRMELKQGINRCYLLDDSYSNDLAGLEIALNYLVQQKQNSKHTVILSDLLQTGYEKKDLYRRLLQLLKAFPIQRLIMIGPESHQHQEGFQQANWKFQQYQSTADFLSKLSPSTFNEENILIKGARVFGFEQITLRLQQKIHSTTLEINLDAITHNLNFFRSRLQKDTKLMVMVKAFSYGGAAFEIASLLQYHQVDYLAVAYPDEGVMLRHHGIRLPILVLNPTVESFDLMARYQLEPEIYSLSLLKNWAKLAVGYAGVHLKMDTGMHRLGFMKEDMPALLQFLEVHPEITINSIFTHLVASEDPQEDTFSTQQIRQYQQMYDQLEAALGYRPVRHVLNSAGIQRFPEFQMDMVRLGLGLYGVDTSQMTDALRPISRLKTIISQIKTLAAGESVGYNRAGKVNQPKRIATLAIGYADGLDRRLGNGRFCVLVNGNPAPTIGNICMDMTMVDISSIDAREGDEVIIFGEEQPVQMLAEMMGTIPYEVLTGISERVKRVFFSDT